jgi:hypothetical protein
MVVTSHVIRRPVSYVANTPLRCLPCLELSQSLVNHTARCLLSLGGKLVNLGYKYRALSPGVIIKEFDFYTVPMVDYRCLNALRC